MFVEELDRGDKPKLKTKTSYSPTTQTAPLPVFLTVLLRYNSPVMTIHSLKVYNSVFSNIVTERDNS